MKPQFLTPSLLLRRSTTPEHFKPWRLQAFVPVRGGEVLAPITSYFNSEREARAKAREWSRCAPHWRIEIKEDLA